MTRKGIARIVPAVALTYALAAVTLVAQCPTSVVATGLQAPTKIIATTGDGLLVAEAGFGPNMGRISLVDPGSGQVRTLVDGLPSGFSPPNNDPSGPSGLALQGNTLFVTIGLGDAVIAGPIPGTQIANPTPSSQLFSSVLAFKLTRHGTNLNGGFTMTPADQAMLKSSSSASLHNSNGDLITVSLVADFPDYLPEPVAGAAANVRQSNPFGVVAIDNLLYVPDASSNSLRLVNVDTGSFQTLTSFAPLPNSLFPFGPPVIEAVPNSVRRFGDGLFVTLLSGFPFPPGGAQVLAIDPSTGNQTVFITGLTAAIDMTPLKRSDNMSVLTLEFSTNMLLPQPAPGRLRIYRPPYNTSSVVADCLITPTSMALDKTGSQAYVTEIFTGRVIKVALP
jgi:hypothetical protein